jgi:hypothetical protein
MPSKYRRWTILASVVLGYFMSFPSDLKAALAPITEVLTLTNAISPWLYGLLASGVIAWAIVRSWAPAQRVPFRE